MTVIEKILTQINIPRTKIFVKETIGEGNKWGVIENLYNLKVTLFFINTSEEEVIYDEYLPASEMSLQEASEKFVTLVADVTRRLTILCMEKYKSNSELFEEFTPKIVEVDLTPEKDTTTLLNVLKVRTSELNDKTEL